MEMKDFMHALWLSLPWDIDLSLRVRGAEGRFFWVIRAVWQGRIYEDFIRDDPPPALVGFLAKSILKKLCYRLEVSA